MFINLMPHEVVILPADGGEIRIPSTGLARCKAGRVVVDRVSVDGVSIPVTEVVIGEVENLPEPQEGVVFIVSLLVAQKAARDGRTADILVPDESVRDEAGRIIGCRALARQP